MLTLIGGPGRSIMAPHRHRIVAQIITAYKLITRTGGCVILKQNPCHVKQLMTATNSVRSCDRLAFSGCARHHYSITLWPRCSTYMFCCCWLHPSSSDATCGSPVLMMAGPNRSWLGGLLIIGRMWFVGIILSSASLSIFMHACVISLPAWPLARATLKRVPWTLFPASPRSAGTLRTKTACYCSMPLSWWWHPRETVLAWDFSKRTYSRENSKHKKKLK